MPAIVLVGAQWGDEGKGKVTDLLGGDVDYVVRYQGGNNAGHTVVIGDQTLRAAPAPLGILSPGRRSASSATAWSSTRVCCWRRSTGSRTRGIYVRPAPDLRRRAPDHAVPHGRSTRSPSATSARPRSAPPAAASGPRTGTRSRGSGIRVQDLLDPRHPRAEARSSRCATRTRSSPRSTTGGRSTPDADRRGVPRLRRAAEARTSPTPRSSSTGRSTTARSCSSRAPRARCSTSTTARTRSSPPPTRPRAARAPARASGRPASTAVIGILKAYTTRVGSGPVPDRAARRDRRVAAQDRRRVRRRRPAATAAAAGSTR